MDNQDVVDKLWDLKFIGPFPLGIIVLLVSPEVAYKEINSSMGTTFTIKTFKTLLKNEDIHIFNTVEDWERYKNPPKERKRLEGIYVS